MEFDIKFNNVVSNILGDSFFENHSAFNSLNSIDSLAYVELLVALQKEFNIKFSTQEFSILKSLDQIKELVLKKTT